MKDDFNKLEFKDKYNEFINLSKDFILKNKRKIILVALIILTVLILIGMILIISISVIKYINRDIEQKYEIYDKSKFDAEKYPGYVEKIDEVIKKHPNWNITILYTKLDWNEVIKNEGHKDGSSSPTNLIADYKNYPKDYECEKCKGKKYDNGTWLCASDKAIKHQMDPRNFIDNELIYQFKELKYEEEAQTIEGIKEITKESFLKEENIIKAIVKAGKKANLDCYFIASRLIQEQGKKGSTLSRGYEYNDKIVYNPFNINAKGNSTKEILDNAGKYAYEKQWFSLEKSLVEGIDFVKTGYIEKGQNTLYFQKFDVIKNILTNKKERQENKNKDLYINQYMQNLFAPESESKNMIKFYKKSNTFENKANFIIPVYENMGEIEE